MHYVALSGIMYRIILFERRIVLSKEVVMTKGSIGQAIIRFAIPLFFGNLFQQLYNTADTFIVGKLIGNDALAAVSSTGSIVFLLVGFFNGISLGGGVVVSQRWGAKSYGEMRKAIHTNLTLSLIFAIILTAAGTLLAPQILVWMDCPEDILPLSAEYIQVYFAGSVGMVLYNCCMGIMQAVGDSKHPLIYLIISSCINVVLDIVFIAAFNWGVAGAAIATVISQIFSVILCLIRLMRVDSEYRVSFKSLGIDWESAKLILKYGLPTGLQNSVISIANVLVQSNVNAFGKMAMAGNGAYAKLEGFAFLPVTCFTSAITTFVGQNLGAGEYSRVKKGARFGMLCSMAIAEAVGIILFFGSEFLIGLFTEEAESVMYGVMKAHSCSLFFFMLAAAHCLSAVMRGAGKSTVPMLTMLICWCAVRVAALSILVPIYHSIHIVNWIFPITWTLSVIVLGAYYFKVDWIGDFIRKQRAKAETTEG